MIRILFVDDEVNMLSAMRRTLHGMRAEWAVEFASSGAEALDLLERIPADVIVSDMHMPGMDGWQLLAAVKSRHPQTARLLLSGHADPASIMRSVGTAHQYLSKPCESAALKAAIVQTQSVRRLLSSERLAAIVGRIGMLPGAPLTFQELLACLRESRSSIADIARIIGRDVAMTANIMKLVNSAFFGSRNPIYTAERAVAYLGLDTVGALVLGHDVFQGGAAANAGTFDHAALWFHSIQTAAAARAIARHERLPVVKADEAFLAGLLHDVGKVVVAAASGAPAESGIDMHAHHAEVGGYLLGLWGFPIPIVEGVAFHHTPSQAADEGFGLAGIVHVADRLTRGLGPAGYTAATPLEEGYLERLGLLQRLPRWTAALNELNSSLPSTGT
jgi:HD-like signal output (HDOD) protein